MITGFSLCLRVRLSGNGNKHFCLPMWSDSTSCNPVLFRGMRRHKDAQTDEQTDGQTGCALARQEDEQTDKKRRERHQTCYTVIRLV